MEKRRRFVIRDETFGYTLFDRDKLRYKFLKKDELTKDLEVSGVHITDLEQWTANTSDLRTDVIYSPIRVYFEITRACNLRCKTCFNSSAKAMPDELTTKEMKYTLEGLRADHVFDLRFSGGELTVRSDWDEILAYAKELGFAVSLNTNAVYDNPSTIDRLATLDVEQVTVSIDGGREFHDYIRGKGSFDRTVDALLAMHQRGIRLRINTVLTKGAANDLEEILSLAGDIVDEINFFYMRITGRATYIRDQVMSFEELHQFEKDIEPLKALYPHVNILHGSRVMVMNSISTDHQSKIGLQMGGPDGFTRFNILPDGGIWPGGYTPYLSPDFYLGNIKENDYSVLKIWQTSAVLDRFRIMSLDLQKVCLSCPEKNVRCPGASVEMELYREKDPDKKNPCCIY